MCGIVGIIGKEAGINIAEMMSFVTHRGPDDAGYYINEDLAFGHQRLSILDLSSNGHQPMISQDGNFVIIFNGEIYNHLEIRKELTDQGITFKSRSDTETLVNGYQLWKEGILGKLNGIFAFAIYNIQEKEIFIARDQFGVKPLYYYKGEDIFLFGSELKSFLKAPSFEKTIDAEGIVNYLNYLWSPGETTSFKNAKKLLPGHYLKFKIHEIQIKPVKYYDIPFTGKYSTDSEENLVNKLEKKLLTAVDRQLLSDVPVGFFLSGGLDSSLLVAIVKKLYPERKIQAFTIDTGILAEKEGFVDDLHYAKLVAEYLNIDLEIIKADIDIVKDFDKMVWHLDEPQADVAPLHVLNICKRAKEMDYKVMIGGAGGDDLFSGYRRHQALKYEKSFFLLPFWIRKAFKWCAAGLPSSVAKFRRLRKLTEDIDKEPTDRQAGYFSWLPISRNKSLLLKPFLDHIKDYNPLDYLKSLLPNITEEKSSLNRMLYWELKSFLVDHNLNYTDKLSMAVGVEARVPYLDKELVEFTTIIPPHLKMKGNETKYILKKVAEKYLPKEVIYRPKTGFGAPVREWIKNDLDKMINEKLNKERLNQQGIFNGKEVEGLVKDNKSGKIDASYSILSLLAIESWIEQFEAKPYENLISENVEKDSFRVNC